MRYVDEKKMSINEGNNPFNNDNYWVVFEDIVTKKLIVLEGFETLEQAQLNLSKWKSHYNNVQIIDYDPLFEKKETKKFNFKINKPIKINESIYSEGILIVKESKEEENDFLLEKSIRLSDDLIAEKGSYIAIKNLKESWDIMDEYDISKIIDNAIKSSLEDALYGKDKSFDDFDDLVESCEESLPIDETDLISLSDSQVLDLCIYQEDQTGEKIPNNTSWEEFTIVRDKYATTGLYLLATNQLREKLEVIENTFEKENIDFSEVKFSTSDSFGYFAPESVDDVKGENVSVYHYRNIEGETNVDVYEFHDLDLYGIVYV